MVPFISTSTSKEVAVDGVVSELIPHSEEVTWQATLDRSASFVDEMVFGAFQSMKLTHRFIEHSGHTEMIDELEFRAPLMILGRIAERVFLTLYMRRFLIVRSRVLKEIAESDRWMEFLDEG